jgi:hypothetical protein
MGPMGVTHEAVETYEKRTGFFGTGTITVENGYVPSVTNKESAQYREQATDWLAGLLRPSGLLHQRGVL